MAGTRPAWRWAEAQTRPGCVPAGRRTSASARGGAGYWQERHRRLLGEPFKKGAPRRFCDAAPHRKSGAPAGEKGAVIEPAGLHAPETESGAAWSPGEDGSLVEGAVAAFFFDLRDPANEPADPVAYPYSYLTAAIKTCRVYANTISGSTMWVIPDGIDFLTYCLENRIDPAVTGSSVFFTDRDNFLYGDPTDFMESASEPAGWSASDLRSLWTSLLYGQ